MKVLIALSNFEREDAARFESVEMHIAAHYAGSILFRVLTFDGFIAGIEQLVLSASLSAMVGDFRAYLDSEGLLSTWRTKLDVVNCVTTMHEVEGGCYLCPPARGAYKHARAKFFGSYKGKTVDRICLTEAVVEFDNKGDGRVAWTNVDGTKANFISRAAVLLERFRPGQYPHQVFVLGESCTTDFRKDTSGGCKEANAISPSGTPPPEILLRSSEIGIGATWSKNPFRRVWMSLTDGIQRDG